VNELEEQIAREQAALKADRDASFAQLRNEQAYWEAELTRLAREQRNGGAVH
jgi:hypothetical protein